MGSILEVFFDLILHANGNNGFLIQVIAFLFLQLQNLLAPKYSLEGSQREAAPFDMGIH